MTTNDGSRGVSVTARRAIQVTMALAALLLGNAGCGSETHSEIRSYVDSAGRSCTTDVADISGTATCDADPVALTSCASGQEAAFVVNDDYDFDVEIWSLESCAGCVDRAAHQTFIASGTCSLISCETDEDCLHDNYMCMSGVCHHM
jgi:hypothetical protein